MCRISHTYGSFERTGWRLQGGYAAMPTALRDELREFYEPYNAALRVLLGCDPFHS